MIACRQEQTTGDEQMDQRECEQTGCKQEEVWEHFTRWFKWGMTTHEFWEIFFTDRRIIFAFVGETYTTFLLRGDASDRKRESLKKAPPEAILHANRENYALSYGQIEQIILKRGNLLKMPCLTVKTRAGLSKSFFIDDRRYDLQKHLPVLTRLLPGKVSLR